MITMAILYFQQRKFPISNKSCNHQLATTKFRYCFRSGSLIYTYNGTDFRKEILHIHKARIVLVMQVVQKYLYPYYLPLHFKNFYNKQIEPLLLIGLLTVQRRQCKSIIYIHRLHKTFSFTI